MAGGGDSDGEGDVDVSAAGITAPRLQRRVTWSRMVATDDSNSEALTLDTVTAPPAKKGVRPLVPESLSDSDSEEDAPVPYHHHHARAASGRSRSPVPSLRGGGGKAAPATRVAAPAPAPPPAAPAPAPAAAPQHLHKCAEVLAALRAAGLCAKRVRSLSRRMWLIKIRAPEWRLELEAERIRLRMRRRDGGWSRFKRSMRDAFVALPSGGSGGSRAGSDADEEDRDGLPPLAGEGDGADAVSLFHSSDRQTLLDHILRSSVREGGADLGDTTPLGAYVTHMFPLHMRARLEELQSDWLSIWRPARSLGAFDRIGVVDAAWYAPPRLVDLSTPRRTFCGIPYGTAGAAAPSGSTASAPKVTVVAAKAAPPPPPPPPACGGACARGGSCSACGAVARCAAAVASCVCKARRSTRRLCCGALSQPLDRIAAYYGETVAFYFAWLEFYTQWLVAPAVAGALLFLGQVYAGSLDVGYVPLFSMFMAVWSILFLEMWKRRNAELAQRWGVLHYEDEEVVRPQFVGKWKQDAATGALLRVYPTWRRALKYAVTAPIICACLVGIVLLMVFVFSTRDHLLAQFDVYETAVAEHAAMLAAANGSAVVGNVTLPPEPELRVDVVTAILDTWRDGIVGFLRGDPITVTGAAGASAAVTAAAADAAAAAVPASGVAAVLAALRSRVARLEAFFSARPDWRWWLAMAVPPVAVGTLLPALDAVFQRMALAFNEWENHATESAYRNHRIAKVFVYRFFASFVSLFYYAFSPQHSALSLFVQLAAFLLVGQLVNKVLEVTGSCLRVGWRECRAARRAAAAEESGLAEGRRGRRLLRHAGSEAWRQARLPAYDTFNEYASMLIQFGYVTFFSWAFPLAPLCALANNMIEMRTDAYKLCALSQRPIAYKAGGIGVWYNVLVAQSILAVLTNCAHLALSSAQFRAYFPGVTDTERLLVVFVIEHLVLSLRILMAYIIPPVSASVRRRAARDAWALAKLQGRRSVGEASALADGASAVDSAPGTLAQTGGV